MRLNFGHKPNKREIIPKLRLQSNKGRETVLLACLNLPWFRRIGICYLPISFVGWIIAVAAFVYAIYVFIDVDKRSHSVSDTLMNFVFNLLIIIAVYSLIAYLTGKKRIV